MTGSDRVRQLGVTFAEVLCIVGSLVGAGVIGTRVDQTSDGALTADATLLAPLGPAFSIWSVVYLGLAAYTVWQWLPSAARDARARATGWLAAASMLLNAGWLLVTQRGWIWVSVVVIIALVLVLALLVHRLAGVGGDASLAARVVVDGTFGLYLGWVCVATCANVLAALTASGLAPTSVVAQALALALLATVVGVAVLIQRRTGRRWSFALAVAWGLGWIAAGRLTDQPESLVTGTAAVAAALLVLVITSRAEPATSTA